MQRTIVVDNEYLGAQQNYSKAASDVHKATEYFKKRAQQMIVARATTGKTAHSMSLYLREMSSVLKATFKEQISLADIVM
jgi:hypothetical protein